MSSKKIMILTAGFLDLRRLEDLYEAEDTWHMGEKQVPPLQMLFYEHKAHRLLVYDSHEFHVLLAYGEFCLHPPIKVLANDLWLYWLDARFCLDLPITLINSMFFTFFICKKSHTILKKVIMEVFYAEHKMNYIMVVKPPDQPEEQYANIQALGKTFYPTLSKVSEQGHLPSVIVIQRKDIMPVISFRKALPEDNDDIVDMIDSEDPDLRRKFGDYYIAEQLLNVDGTVEKDKIIIAEFEEEIAENVKGAGLMWLSDSIDVQKLANNFHLERLGNLVRYTPGQKHGNLQFDVFSLEQKSFKELYNRSKMDELYEGLKVSQINLQAAESEHSVHEKTILFSKFKYIYDELRRGSYYMNAYKDKLVISFDLPDGEDSHNGDMVELLGSASNGFLLKMFQLHPLVRSEYTFFSLSAMFSAFPKHDYCVTKVPTTTTMSPCQRELFRFFLPVAYRPNSDVSENVFVAHRSTLFGDLRVFRLERNEIDEIKVIVSSQSHKRDTVISGEDKQGCEVHDEYIEEVLLALDSICTEIFDNPKTDMSCFTVRCGQSKTVTDCPIVGFLVLRPFEIYEDLSKVFMLPRDQFNLTYNRGEVVMFKLHPFFQMWCDPIFRTAALHDNYRELYYLNHYIGFSLPNDLMHHMMPVEPRRMKKNLFSNPCLKIKQRISKGSMGAEVECSTRLRVFCHNLMPTKQLGAKSSLVIVGFSETCRAFMRLVIFAWNTKDLCNFRKHNCLPMVDLTVVVPHGVVEAAYDCDFFCNYCGNGRNCFVNTGNLNPFVRDSMQRMDLRHWVRFVPGRVKHINRDKQVLHLVDGCNIHYEKLILMDAIRFGFEDKEFQEHPIPLNYVVTHHRLERLILYHKLREMVECGHAYQIIVYGYGLAVYDCLHFLVTHGCPAEYITYVQPHVPCVPELLSNPEVDERLDPIILDMVADLGITVYLSTNFNKLILSEDHTSIEQVEFLEVPSKDKIILDCDLFINFNKNFLTTEMERILANCGLETRHRKVVVNANYCTNDRNIYAAGRYIMIRPKPNFQYSYTAPHECAEKLAYELNLVKTVMQSRFSKPFMFTGILPMDYQIIKINYPKPLLIGQLPSEYSESMTTFDDGDFCRIRVNRQLIVMEIVCVTKKPKRLYFMEYFCGKHVMLLNDMRNRFQAGWIPNLITFFEQPWTELIMHERFDDLQLKNRRVLLSMLLMNTNTGGTGTQGFRPSTEGIQRQKLEENVINFVRTYRRDFIHSFALPEDWGLFNI